MYTASSLAGRAGTAGLESQCIDDSRLIIRRLINLRRLPLLIAILTSLQPICIGRPIKSSLPVQFASQTSRQEGNSTTWKEFSSIEGRFSVLLPGTPSLDVTQIDTRAGQVPNYAYALATDAAVFVIMYSDMPAYSSEPARQREMLDAGRDRMLAGDKTLHIVSEADISLAGNLGREMVTQDESSISKARCFIVNGRIYVTMFVMETDRALKSRSATPTPENRTDLFEATAAKFLDSFKLTEGSRETLGEVDRLLRDLKENRKDIVVVFTVTDATQPGSSAGIVNGRAVHLVAPTYPAIARAAHASGSVSVKVVIDLEGNIAAAQVVAGHPLLQAAAIKAARESKFTPTQLNGKTVMVAGVIIYNFVAQ